MKKFAIGVLAICMVVLLVISLNGGFDDVENKNMNFNEAAFSIPSSISGSKDISSFLIGEFTGDDGTHLSLDGNGYVKLTRGVGFVQSGTYTLLQQSDGSAMLRFIFESGDELYAFALCSDCGDFILADKDGNETKYTPVLI
ncbi:MAG: hypothetical protein E7420_03565 [Ruminococcaceae bacterium]|nr:hypothetical protein [Oscillospiraceae bacterium]